MASRPHLDQRRPSAKNGDHPLTAVLVEHADPEGKRWAAALELLLEAGRNASEAPPPR